MHAFAGQRGQGDRGPHERGPRPTRAEAEVDVADLWIDLCGVRIKVFLSRRGSRRRARLHRAFYCQPGIDGAHEKGGVEGEGDRFRPAACLRVEGGAACARRRMSGAPRRARQAVHSAGRPKVRVPMNQVPSRCTGFVRQRPGTQVPLVDERPGDRVLQENVNRNGTAILVALPWLYDVPSRP